jgi:tRNA (guanine37-N1)-methyltransferase
MLQAITAYGITSRALKQGIAEIQCFNPRDYTTDKHKTVDDRPYGGGPGMLMMIQPLKEAIDAAKGWSECQSASSSVIYLSPQGTPLNQSIVNDLAAPPEANLVLVAGRYEGIDERIIHSMVDTEISIGDYVLSGGELPAMVLIDSMIRQLPGALGHSASADEDSFAEGLLDCPHYTRPEIYEGRSVPEVLLSGDHEKIRRWRLKQALIRTYKRRPDLLSDRILSDEESALLNEYLQDSQ